MSLSIIGNFFFHIREKCFQGRDFAPEGWLYCSEQSEGCYRNPREQNPAQGHTSVWDRRKIIRTFFHFWCWMGLSFFLYRVLLTFECSKLWPRQPLQPLKPLLDFWNSALGKTLPNREETTILKLLGAGESLLSRSKMRFWKIFFRGDEKKTTQKRGRTSV